jgi:hypothetical protein
MPLLTWFGRVLPALDDKQTIKFLTWQPKFIKLIPLVSFVVIYLLSPPIESGWAALP